jgi:hypothetical protein
MPTAAPVLFNAPGVHYANAQYRQWQRKRSQPRFRRAKRVQPARAILPGHTDRESGGFINFRVYDDTGFPAGSVGPIDLDEEQSGAALWTLDAGTTYSIEVTADGAEWSYTLKCR